MSAATITDEIVSRLMAEGALPLPLLLDRIAEQGGSPPALSTITKWIVYGKHQVKLEAYSGDGQGWSTSLEALARFYAALTRRRQAAFQPTPAAVQRRAAAAGEELARLRRGGSKQ